MFKLFSTAVHSQHCVVPNQNSGLYRFFSADAPKPASKLFRVFFDINIDDQQAGRIVFEVSALHFSINLTTSVEK